MRYVRTAVVFRIAVCLAVGGIVASAPVLSALRGHGLWLFVAAIAMSLPSVFAAQKKLLSVDVAREIHGAACALIGMSIQYDSNFGVNVGEPYFLRFVLFGAVLVLWSWIGRRFYRGLAPETDVERAAP